MTFRVRTETKEASLPDGTVWILESDTARAEIWPHQGFNCYRWNVHGSEILYADPQLFQGSSPTRSGIPILFPFPNRIRDGRFTWEGKEYQLPLNDSTGKNTIHGFACRRPWRVVAQGADHRCAWVTGEFQGSKDAPDCSDFWPADYRIRITYRLSSEHLRQVARVDAPGGSMPFGLGYHHYFRVEADSRLTVPARKYWELEENLPMGRTLPVDSQRDLRKPRRFADLQLDDVLTDLDLCFRGDIQRGRLHIHMWASPAFREAVVFTPPHHRAFCIEPYTCTTDALNLQARNIEAGWRVLGPGEFWKGIVEMTAHQE